MRQFHPKSYLVMLCLLLATTACRPIGLSPTRQPGEVAVPFETVVLDEEGENLEIEKERQLLVLTEPSDVAQVQPLISTEAVQQVQQVDFTIYNVIALFHPLGAGCAGLGVTIERLTLKNDTLTVYANLWRPPSGHACAEEGIFSPYHLVKVRKANGRLDELELVLQSQVVEKKS